MCFGYKVFTCSRLDKSWSYIDTSMVQWWLNIGKLCYCGYMLEKCWLFLGPKHIQIMPRSSHNSINCQHSTNIEPMCCQYSTNFDPIYHRNLLICSIITIHIIPQTVHWLTNLIQHLPTLCQVLDKMVPTYSQYVSNIWPRYRCLERNLF